MAKLYFKYSAMNSGKTASLIQSAYNYIEQGMNVLIITSSLDNRYGINKVASRTGLELPATAVTSSDSIVSIFENTIESISAVFVDEAQFLTKEQVLELSTLVDKYNVPVLAYGLRTDFRGCLFEGSSELLAIADELSEIKTICTCGRKATMNARKNNDVHQVAVGGNDLYTSMCRACFFKFNQSKSCL